MVRTYIFIIWTHFTNKTNNGKTWGSYSKYCSIQYISIATRWGNLMYGRWCLHAQWWGYFNKMKVYFITWFKLKMYKQKVELNLKKEKNAGNFPEKLAENFQFFRRNFPAYITNYATTYIPVCLKPTIPACPTSPHLIGRGAYREAWLGKLACMHHAHYMHR